MKGISIINRITFIPLHTSRYIGGCCGFEPYHIRAMAEELRDVRGRLPESSDKSDYDLSIHKQLQQTMPRYHRKGDLDYWMNMNPSTGGGLYLL